jgi:hypothetical protein
VTKLFVYLAGAIRDGEVEDVRWRREFIGTVKRGDHPITLLNPLSGKVYSSSAKSWTQWGMIPTYKMIANHDYFCVDKADIIVINFNALGVYGYPMIGSVAEMGYAVAKGKVIWSIIPEGVTPIHPFINHASTMIFNTCEACVKFLIDMSYTLTGKDAN